MIASTAVKMITAMKVRLCQNIVRSIRVEWKWPFSLVMLPMDHEGLEDHKKFILDNVYHFHIPLLSVRIADNTTSRNYANYL